MSDRRDTHDVTSADDKQNLYRARFKRKADLCLSAAGIVALLPLLAGVALAIKIDDPGPVLFSQERVGTHKSRFDVYKFRTMRTNAPRDVPTHQLADPDRYITRMGRFLRRTSLDELPQLLNILRGDMSVVGPRPCLPNQTDLIAERDRYGANDIAPGLTGWAQVNGRDELEIPAKARFDGEYAANISPVMDARCLLITVGSVIDHDGVVEGGTGRVTETAAADKGLPLAGDDVETPAPSEASVRMSSEKLEREERTGIVVVAGALAAACGIVALLAHRR